MIARNILLSLCFAFALIYSTVKCEDNLPTHLSNTDSVEEALPPDHVGCRAFREKCDEINSTKCNITDYTKISKENKNNVTIQFLYDIFTAYECVFCELKDVELFSSLYDNCSAIEESKNRKYANELFCGLETLTCAFENMCDYCPNYFRELKVDCKKEAKM